MTSCLYVTEAQNEVKTNASNVQMLTGTWWLSTQLSSCKQHTSECDPPLCSFQQGEGTTAQNTLDL